MVASSQGYNLGQQEPNQGSLRQKALSQPLAHIIVLANVNLTKLTLAVKYHNY